MAIVYANDNNFAANVSQGVSIVDFYADWCGPCKMIAPVLEQISKEMADINIVKLNVDENPAVSQTYGIMSIPTLMLFKNGKAASKVVGYQPKESLKNWILKNK